MNQEIYDWTLHQFLHRALEENLPLSERLRMKTLISCGKKIAYSHGGVPSVFLASNGQSAKFFGIAMCKNPWACPCCSAYMMSKYSAEIGVALDALKEQGYFGFMITFTIPHLKFMSCRETTDILYKVRDWFRRVAKQKNNRRRVDGSLGERTETATRKFFRELDIKHSVTVCEYTYGKNGWHPHFHAIYWVKREFKDEVLKYESALNEEWMAHAKKITLDYWNKNRMNGLGQYLNEFYEKCEKEGGLYISKNDGVIAESLSSEYISGWGANRELTGNYRKEASHDGHLTPYQMLDKAYHGDKKMLQLYIEFCQEVTRKPVHHRVIWSQTGLKAIIKTAQQTEKCRELLRKKKDAPPWRVVCILSKESWLELQELNRDFPILANVLYLTVKDEILLREYLDYYGIVYDEPESNYFTSHIEDILNRSLKQVA